MRIGFDNEKYLKMQSEHIRERVEKFGDKLSDAAKLFETKKQWDWTDLMCDFCNLKAQTENRMARLGSGISEFVSNTKSKFIK